MKSSQLPDSYLSSYAYLVRAHLTFLCLTAFLGAFIGAAYQASIGTLSLATQSVLVSSAIDQGLPPAEDFSLDTEAQFIKSATVIRAISMTLRLHDVDPQIREALNVTATPNSRILHIQFAYPNSAQAQAGVVAATQQYLKLRAATLEATRVREVAVLEQRSDLLINQFSAARRILTNAGDAANARLRTSVLRLMYQANYVSNRLAKISHATIDPGRTLGEPTTRPSLDGWVVKSATGLAIGATLALLVAWLFDGFCVSVGGGLGRRHLRPVPVVCSLSSASKHSANMPRVSHSDMCRARSVMRTYAPVHGVLAVGNSAAARRVATGLNVMLDEKTGHDERFRVLLVGSPKDRVIDIARTRGYLESTGQKLVGVIWINA